MFTSRLWYTSAIFSPVQQGCASPISIIGCLRDAWHQAPGWIRNAKTTSKPEEHHQLPTGSASGSRNKDLDWENVHGNEHAYRYWIFNSYLYIYIHTYTYLFTWYRDINLLQHIQNAVMQYAYVYYINLYTIINLYILQYINLIYSELDIGIFGMQKTWRPLAHKNMSIKLTTSTAKHWKNRYVTEGLLTRCCHYEGGIVFGHIVIAVETRRFWLWV